MKGRFIAFEGGEGAGKSTQARLLADWLERQSIATDLTREPGGTPGAEAIRALLLDPPSDAGWGAQAEALLFAAARADHVAQRIRPALESGTWVICDRFVASSRAYQGGAGGLGDDAILALHEFGSEALQPDLTILLEVSEAQMEARLNARDQGASDAIGGRSADYHRAVALHFRAIAERESEGLAIIDGEGAPEEVHARVCEAIEPLLNGRFK
ncbi:MAG: dTMP kinase [Pseudomonadota bacterium]